jgi:hypothetical protein
LQNSDLGTFRSTRTRTRSDTRLLRIPRYLAVTRGIVKLLKVLNSGGVSR